MVRRRHAVLIPLLLAVLALLAPFAALADSCTDCLWGASAKCCPCFCCFHGSSTLTVAREGCAPARTGLLLIPVEGNRLSTSPRAVFHVPKASLV